MKESDSCVDKYVRCNLCDQDDYMVLFEANVAQTCQIVRCNHCGLMYANPRSRPTDEEILKRPPSRKLIDQPWFQGRKDKEQLQVSDYETIRKKMAHHFPHKGLMLEIGSSLGYGLKSWHDDGWAVTGVEPMAEGAAYAQEHFGMTVYPTTLLAAKLPPDYFDVIVMLHVIEHVDDPAAELHEIFRVLKPGGRFVCETPRFDSLMFRILGNRERSLSCDGHIYFFTIDTLKAFANKAGFEVEDVQLVGRSMTMERLLWNIGRVSKSKWLQQIAARFSTGLNLRRIRLYVNTRDMQCMTFIKPLNPRVLSAH